MIRNLINSSRNFVINQNLLMGKCLFANVASLNLDNVDREKKLKMLHLEIDVFRQEGRKAPNPEQLKQQHWDHILSLCSRSARSKYYSFLWKIEKKNENLQIKKEAKRLQNVERKQQLIEENKENDHIIYGLSHTSFLLRVYDTTINQWHNNKLVTAMKFGEKLVYDCSYDSYMTKREAINAAKQLMLVFAENRMHDNPFDLHFCNVDQWGETYKYLERHIPPLSEPWFPLNIHAKSFTEIFPKERLVYLTPHCKNELTDYNPDDIYIVGAMVDKVNNEPLSLGKAKQLGLRMAKLPLDRYLQWNGGSGKSLTLNQMCSILLEQKDKCNWNESFKLVPRRKLVITDRPMYQPDLDSYKFKMNQWSTKRYTPTNKRNY